MTVGYPDWQGFANTTGPPLAAQLTFHVSSTTPFSASGYVTSYPAMRLRIKVSSSLTGASAVLTYYTDSTLAVPVGSYSWTFGPTQLLAALVPNLGPFAVLSVTTTSAGGFNMIIEAIPFVTAPPSPRYLGAGNDASLLNVSVAAAGSSSVVLPQIAEGPGYLFVQPGDTLGKLNAVVWEMDQTGALTVKVAELDAFTGPATQQLYGSSSGLQLVVTNTDAGAAHSLYARLAVDGR